MWVKECGTYKLYKYWRGGGEGGEYIEREKERGGKEIHT